MFLLDIGLESGVEICVICEKCLTTFLWTNRPSCLNPNNRGKPPWCPAKPCLKSLKIGRPFFCCSKSETCKNLSILLETNSSHLKIHPWKRGFLLETIMFGCELLVSGRVSMTHLDTFGDLIFMVGVRSSCLNGRCGSFRWRVGGLRKANHERSAGAKQSSKDQRPGKILGSERLNRFGELWTFRFMGYKHL